MRRRFPFWVVLALLSGIALSGIVAGVVNGAALSSASSAKADKTDKAGLEPSPPAEKRAPVVLFIGDSYAAGYRPVPEEESYATQTAKRLDWQMIVAANGGMGFVSRGRLGKTFQDVFDTKLAWRPAPDLVVISGGHNDLRYPLATIQQAADRLVGEVQLTWKDTPIALVGPMWGGDAPKGGALISSTLAEVAKRQQVAYVDPVAGRWMTNELAKKYILEDGTHPNLAGHTYFANRLIDGLKKAGISEELLHQGP